MAKRVANHIHKYKKINLGSNGKDYFVYKCMRPACSHYTPIAQAEGKLCECNRCGEPMIINKIVLNGSGGRPMARPHCSNCIQHKEDKAQDVAAIAEFLSGNKI
jgi:hypothetical protein